MKFTWGHGIVIGMAAFMIFILYYVVRVQTDASYDNQLVTEDYYQEEINVDKKYRALQNAQTLGNELSISRTNEGIAIQFPEKMDIHSIKGTIKLYRPSEEKDDQSIPINLKETSNLLIPYTQLKQGKWEISVDFEYEGKNYLKTESFIL